MALSVKNSKAVSVDVLKLLESAGTFRKKACFSLLMMEERTLSENCGAYACLFLTMAALNYRNGKGRNNILLRCLSNLSVVVQSSKDVLLK